MNKLSLKSMMLITLLKKYKMLTFRDDKPEEFRDMMATVIAKVLVSGINIRRMFGTKKAQDVRRCISQLFYEWHKKGYEVRWPGGQVAFADVANYFVNGVAVPDGWYFVVPGYTPVSMPVAKAAAAISNP